MDDPVRYQIELFHGESGLRNYQEAGIVDCTRNEFLPISGFLGGLMGAVVAHVEVDDPDQFDDYEICIFIRKLPSIVSVGQTAADLPIEESDENS